MQKVLIISNKDSIWLIPSWKKVVKKFSKDINFVEIVYLPEKLKNFNFFQSIIYYLNMFGLFSFTLLSLFSLWSNLISLSLLLSYVSTSEATAVCVVGTFILLLILFFELAIDISWLLLLTLTFHFLRLFIFTCCLLWWASNCCFWCE